MKTIAFGAQYLFQKKFIVSMQDFGWASDFSNDFVGGVGVLTLQEVNDYRLEWDVNIHVL